MSEQMLQLLNKQVANWTVLYMKFHHYHWFIKGHHFFTLHKKFEELYEEANEHIDDIAERILAIGGSPISKLSDCLKVATISEANGYESEQAIVQGVIDDFQKILEECEQVIEMAQSENDEGTADMFIGMMKSLNKHLWMLKSFLG